MNKPDGTAKPRRWWKYLLILAGTALLVMLGLGWYMTTESFQSMVRARMVAAIEKATGTMRYGSKPCSKESR